MKKYISCVLLIFIATFLTVNVFALTTEDSVQISETVLNAVRNNSDDTVIRLYKQIYMKRFAEKQDVTEQIEAATELFMVIEPSGEITYKKLWEGEYVNISVAKFSDWKDHYSYITSPELVFGPSVEVTGVYCLDGSASHNGVYIYYVTDEGDYVLYKEFLSSEETYLFPINDFYDFAKTVWEEQKKFIDSDGGSGRSINELYDLEPYEFTPRRNFTIYIWVSLIAISIFIGVFAIYKFKKKRNI